MSELAGLSGGDVDPLLARAFRHADDGEWDEAAEALRSALDDRPDDPIVLCWLGVAERELGMEGIAYERFKRCLALDPEDPTVLATAGAAVARLDDPSAEPALRAAVLRAPDLVLARTMYGAYLAREGLYEDALRELNAAVELDGEDRDARLERGVALALSGNHRLALDDFEEAARLGEDDGWATVLSGLSLHELNRLDEAARELALGAYARPEDLGAQLLAALASAALDDESTAWEMLERARFAAGEADVGILLEVEERIEGGAESARRFLADAMAPTALHERLMTRP